ncbi:hypothetical protein [Nocardiopsis valliformis]|uniref:hypothetical protein n=1 Tax=Nocardiopsis valliformis TaxID=239974 RepID=UPI000349D1DF|nr:hypothetical protein [Nocardiopsis valliformis]
MTEDPMHEGPLHENPLPENAEQRPPSKQRAGWGRERVRAELALAVWEVELAAQTGLLPRLPDRRFEVGPVEAALADPRAFRLRLAAEHRLNATEAARRLSVSRDRFTRVAAETGLQPVSQTQVRKYGRILDVRYYRAADVDALIPHVRADIVLREAVTAVGRSEAARKAARTRARNRERAARARLDMYALEPAPGSPATQVVAHAAGLTEGLDRLPAFLHPFVHVPEAEHVTALVHDCRFTTAEHAAVLDGVTERARAALDTLVDPDEVWRRLGVYPGSTCDQPEELAGHLPASTVAAWAENPPEWLLSERAALVAAEAEQAAHRSREEEERRVLHQAEHALACTDTTVAELFGLPVDTVTQLRRLRGKAWNWTHVSQLRDRPPAWVRSPEAARAEVERRRARKTKAKERRKRRGKPGQCPPGMP